MKSIQKNHCSNSHSCQRSITFSTWFSKCYTMAILLLVNHKYYNLHKSVDIKAVLQHSSSIHLYRTFTYLLLIRIWALYWWPEGRHTLGLLWKVDIPKGWLYCKVDSTARSTVLAGWTPHCQKVDVPNVECQNVDVPSFIVRVRVRVKIRGYSFGLGFGWMCQQCGCHFIALNLRRFDLTTGRGLGQTFESYPK